MQDDKGISHCCPLKIKVIKTVNPKSSHHKENVFSIPLYLYEMMVFTKLSVGIIPCKSNHYAVYLKLMFVLHVKDISMKQGKN